MSESIPKNLTLTNLDCRRTPGYPWVRLASALPKLPQSETTPSKPTFQFSKLLLADTAGSLVDPLPGWSKILPALKPDRMFPLKA